MEEGLRNLNQRERQAKWCARVAACRQSGLSVQQWCDANGVSSKTYYYWQRKLYDLAREQQSAEFVQVAVEQPGANYRPVATLHTGSLSADIYSGADQETLRAIILALKSC